MVKSGFFPDSQSSKQYIRIEVPVARFDSVITTDLGCADRPVSLLHWRELDHANFAQVLDASEVSSSDSPRHSAIVTALIKSTTLPRGY